MDALDLPPLTARIAAEIRERRSSSVQTSLGELPVDYRRDEDDLEYAFIALGLPQGIYAEIDSETFGTLHGLRVYLDG